MEFNILNQIQENLVSPTMDSIMIFFTTIGEMGFIWIATGVILLCFKKYRVWGLLLLISLGISFLIGEYALKNLIERARPFYENTNFQLIINTPSGYSFPSSHATSSFAASWILFKMNKKIGICAIIVALSISFSRLYLYVHYPSDVTAGIILGIICAQLTYMVYNKYIKNKNHAK